MVLEILRRGGLWTARQIVTASGTSIGTENVIHYLGGLYAAREVERVEVPLGSGRHQWRVVE